MSAPPRKLLEDPLSLVLAEFRFSTVQMENYAPTFHEKIRKQFPLDSVNVQQQAQLSNNSVGLQSSNQWCYTSADLTRAIMIAKDRLIYMVSAYDTFADFSKESIEALDVLKEICEPSLLLRVGFRYVNHISPDDDGSDTKLASSVEPHFLQNEALAGLGQGTNHHRFETAVQTDESSTLVIRSLCGKHGLAIMPDLNDGLPLKLKKEGSTDRVALLLDIDHFWRAKNPAPEFKVNTALEQLEKLHEIACEAFWLSTTEGARKDLWMQQ